MLDTRLLNKIQGPEDVRALRFDQLPELAAQVRLTLIATVSRTGGHLASNLGVVELTIALHRIFQSPVDKIVFDVGHQCYTHKLLTGRLKQFDTLRQDGGLSGFPKRGESVHDAFIAGHSSTSISAAIGFARAKKLRGEPGKVIAVIGDGAFSGMVFEALNNIDSTLDNLVVVLNDNEMSISKNVTTFAKHLAKIRNTKRYFRFKDGIQRTVSRIPALGEPIRAGISALKGVVKGSLYHSNLFEDMGLTYLGPVEGHDFSQLCSTLERARNLREPVLVHVHTQKGKGFSQAEENPGAFHGVARFNPQVRQENILSPDSFSEQAGMVLTELAGQDRQIVAVTAAMKYATGLHHFSSRFREEGRFFDVGIAESHAMTFSAALAAAGMRPVFCVYSSFLQRAYDQLLHVCSLEPAHVVLGVDRAGLVGEDGETHQGIFDIPLLTTLPGVTIYSPATYEALRRDFKRALYEDTGVSAVRYPRGKQTFSLPPQAEDRGDYFYLPGPDACMAVTYGRVAGNLLEAVRASGKEYSIWILDKVFPIPEEVLQHALQARRIVFVEESSALGGIGEHFCSALAKAGWQGEYCCRAIEKPVVQQGTVGQCMQRGGLDAGSLAALL